MAKNTAYLDGMLEVPVVSGKSVDICGQDDMYYAFGVWTDFCGLSDEELKKAAIANANGSTDCCGGGGGTGDTKTENNITISASGHGREYTIYATADQSVDVDVTLTIPYVVMFDDGTTETRETEIVLKAGSESANVEISLDEGKVAKIPNNITVSPKESDNFKFVVKNDTDIKINSILYGTVLYTDMEEKGINAITYDALQEFGELTFTGRTAEITSSREGEEDPEYEGQESIREKHAYDYILLIDSDLDVSNIIVTDLQSVGEGEVVDLGDAIGSVEYDDELYYAYRLSNPIGWSVVVGPGEPLVGYTWKYKLTQN